MNSQELKERLKAFALSCIKIAEHLPTSVTSGVISKQIIRSSLSTAANYRAATRAQSKKQFLAKLNIALEEADETLFWLETVNDLSLIERDKLNLLADEAEQIVRILSATKNTTIKNLKAVTAKS